MLKMSAEIIEQHRQLPATWSPLVGGTDRDAAIIGAVELEDVAKIRLYAFIRHLNPKMSEDDAVNALQKAGFPSDASLGRVASLLYALGCIPREIRDDLRASYLIRNHYAHQSSIRLIDEEADLISIISNMEIYKRNRLALESLGSMRNAFRAIVAHLKISIAGTDDGAGE